MIDRYSNDQSAWVLFGDESTAPNIVTYGIVAFELPTQSNAATFAYQRAIEAAGAPQGTRVHCKELFSGEARQRSAWAHLTESQTWDFAIELVETLRRYFARFFLGVVYKDTFPAEIPDGPKQKILLRNEHCYAFGFYGAASAFGSGRAGSRHVLFVNEQSGKAKFWGLGNIQIRRMMEATGLLAQSHNHALLDVADIFAYAAARALSDEPARNKEVCEKILTLCRPDIGHYWWQAPDDKISSKMKKRLGLLADD